MLFAESDAPLLKTWIVNRLANTSDADADVLADYVLALLRHDGDINTIRKLFEEEIPDFLREDAAAFTDDVFQAIKYRSYLPGAPPPPPPPIARQQQHQLQHPHPQPPSAPTQIARRRSNSPQLTGWTPTLGPYPLSPRASRKRMFSDTDDNDVDIILTNRNPYGGPQPYKQARRAGFSQRGGRFDDPFGGRMPRGSPNSYQPSAAGPGLYGVQPFPPAPNAQGLPPLDPNSIMENIQRLQQLGIPIPQMPDLPRPVYSGPAIPPPRRRKQRCRDYDTKGYCSRGSNCNFEHGSESLYVPSFQPSAGDEYDPNNASLPPMPNFNHQPAPHALPHLDLSAFQMTPPVNNRREPKKARRTKGRPPFAFSGPVHDRSKTTIVVQNIPSENFTDDQIRGYFSQFGKIEDLTVHDPDRLAIIKYDTWEAAHAAWSSPKVIFDNRFVKVFWHKDENEDTATANGKPVGGAKNGTANGSPGRETASAEPEFDMEDFKRKQDEAQKIYEQKMEKRQEIERQRQELEERHKELRAKQLEEKRKLQARLVEGSSKDGSSSPTQITTEGTGQPSTQTEALRAQLAALEAEADVLGIDPDQEEGSSWPPRGRGRGRVFRGRGTFPPRASRGSYGYRGRGGGGVEARHAAYAAFSLDNRPRVVALSGVDFTIPERDEALRQYLFGIGEFTGVHTDPAITHVTFKDRKTAEKFMFGISANNTIPGVDEKFEPSWATNGPLPDGATATDGDFAMTSGLEDEQAAKEKAGIVRSSATADLEDGEIGTADDRDQGDMDYEPGEDWGIS